MSFARSPDLYIVVVDCLRFDMAPPASGGTSPLPTLDRLASESEVFTSAVSPASWSLPAHASIFTGTYPWEHRVCYGSAHDRLGPNVPTIASTLRRNGYHTALLSANPWVSDTTGLSSGFDEALWGRVSDCYFRKLTPWTSRAAGRGQLRGQSIEAGIASRLPASVRGVLERVLESYPIFPDSFTRALAFFIERSVNGAGLVSPWIEEQFSKHLTRFPRNEPLHIFVNLMDAHEPYIGLPEVTSSVSEWFQLLRTTQRAENLPDADSKEWIRCSAALKELYLSSLRVIDRRLKSLLQLIADHRNWDKSVVVVTSDHGQSFGEEGTVFHEGGTADVSIRVPLVVKHADQAQAGELRQEWCSTKDLFSCHIHRDFESDQSRVTDSSATSSESEPVFSLSREPFWGHSRAKNRTGELLRGMGRFSVVGYQGTCKAIWRHQDSSRVPDVPGLRFVDLLTGETLSSSPPEPLIRGVSVAGRLTDANGKLLQTDAVESRLRTWGYE